MKLEIQIKGRKRIVEVVQRDGKLHCTLDGRPVNLDAVEVATSTYSILMDGLSYEVRVHPAADGLHITSGGETYVATLRDPRSKPKAASRSAPPCPARWSACSSRPAKRSKPDRACSSSKP
jgi:hypothetical protein